MTWKTKKYKEAQLWNPSFYKTMTWKTNKRLFGLLGYKYQLLDDFAELTINSKRRLTPKDVDILTAKIMELCYKKGELKTEKGTIKYKYNPKLWEK